MSSRIFVRGLPPSINEADFRKHFSAKGRQITDVKLIPQRGIGYVGYKTSEDANGAVKYFNRSYIRMSKVAVELAKSISDPSLKRPRETGANTTPVPVREKTENTRKRKRDVDESDPKLREYLQVMQKGRMSEALPSTSDTALVEVTETSVPQDKSDDEYEEVPPKKKKTEDQVPPPPDPMQQSSSPKIVPEGQLDDTSHVNALPKRLAAPLVAGYATDDEWLRSRTSRLLDLVDVEELEQPQRQLVSSSSADRRPEGAVQESGCSKDAALPQLMDASAAMDAADPSRNFRTSPNRLFVRNLSYHVTEDELREKFKEFGTIEETHVAVDKNGSPKGFAFLLFADASSAEKARQALDGSPFQGRLLHILPAESKRAQGLDEFAISKLPLKQQALIRRKAEAASKAFNWNSLFMSQDAVNNSIADRLGISKSDMLDPTSSDAAVKQALAETNIIQETKAYFAASGVDLDAFKSQKRGDTVILVKNFPYGTSTEELRTLFEAHGPVLKVLMPSSGTIAIVQFTQPGHAKTAFAKLAYTRIKESVLFLEKGPADLFIKKDNATSVVEPVTDRPSGVSRVSIDDLMERNDEETAEPETSSLFVKNLSFTTATAGLEEAFKSLEGFVSARVKTRTDPKRPGEVLSMGFGFVELRTKEDAAAALKVMDGFVLDGHSLSVKPSHKGHDAAEERRREDKARRAAGKRTKIIIKNLPFEATKKDVRVLFGTYGLLRTVRVPMKFDRSRGFGFAEFVTPREAENALNALRDTHLLGRKLVLDYAEADVLDPEEEIAKMQRKVGWQVNKVALQQIMGRGRAKVNIDNGVDGQNDG